MRVLLVSEGIHEESGALESLVRRLVNKIKTSTWDRVSNPRIRAHHGKGQGYFKRAVRWLLHARENGFDALVLVVDLDKFPERVNELTRAQDESDITSGFPRALGIAIKSFDAWMIADEKALGTVLDMVVQTHPSPEDINDPKEVCARLLEQSTCGLSQRQLYSNVAAVADLMRLEQRCSRGFGVFAARLRRL